MIFDWGFRASIKVHHCDGGELTLKSGEQTTFYKFLSQNLTIIDPSKKLWLNPLLFNGSLQSLYYTSHDSSKKFLVYYGRELFTYKDGGQCSLDWVIPQPSSPEEFKKLYAETLPADSPRLNARTRFLTQKELEEKHTTETENTKPICVILHGLAGGSHEPLIRNVAELITAEKNWDAVVINSRGCCRTKVTSGKLFNAFATDDIKEVLVELRKTHPNRPIYAVGFSFGAAMLGNLIGSEDKEVDEIIKAAVLVGCPWDLEDSAHHIAKSWTGSYLFNPALVKFLNKIVSNNYKELNKHEPTYFNEEALQKARKMNKTYEFDDLYTAKIGGFKDAFEYYRFASPIYKVDKYKVPTLAISSTDDPAVSPILPTLDLHQNPNFCLVQTDLGGHLGYVQWSGEFWCANVTHDFFKQFEQLVKDKN